jgi:predicted metal-dependent peptidase
VSAARTQLAVARLAATDPEKGKAPYLSAAVFALVPRETPGLGTMAVTARGVLMWDPAAVDRWTDEEVQAVLIHEAMHVLRDHHVRARDQGADPTLANLCQDAEINDDLKQFQLPKGCIYPSSFGLPDGKTWEEYYALLRQQVKQCPQCGASKDEDEDEDGGGGHKCGHHGPRSPTAGAGWCGSAGARAVPQEPADGDKAEGRSESDLASVRREVAEATQKHAATKGRGSVPSGFLRWAEEMLKLPKVPWQQKLARSCRSAIAWRAGATDYSYSRPSRRQGAIGYGAGRAVLPVLRSPVPQVAVALDTSGSMGKEEVLRALSEARGILISTGAEVLWIACDAAVHAIKRVRDWRALAKEVKGGGGTDFRPVFDALERERNRPDVLVFFTDGQGPAPAAPPANMKVIWVLLGRHRTKPYADGRQVTFGEFIEIDE